MVRVTKAEKETGVYIVLGPALRKAVFSGYSAKSRANDYATWLRS
ncbi:hypothetical protein LCGC14_0423590 [marine sediment metagenome]|uniref:Uncharacterized protein n=1 Tax=marine sediment metagenome TaxID=412755 RepID=A0A0F9VC98_9ZZZZ